MSIKGERLSALAVREKEVSGVICRVGLVLCPFADEGVQGEA